MSKTKWDNKGPIKPHGPSSGLAGHLPPKGKALGGSKYGNEKSMGYDSKREAERARQLHLLERAGAITELREQVRFELIPAIWKTEDGELVPMWTGSGGRRSVFMDPMDQPEEHYKSNGWSCVQRACFYCADFTYKDGHGRFVVEDAKGYQTEAYKVKKKLMRYVHGIEIREV